ncbi:MAG: hypothetical protein V1835_04380 [Candidatus Micrarchaeota archaeon]
MAPTQGEGKPLFRFARRTGKIARRFTYWGLNQLFVPPDEEALLERQVTFNRPGKVTDKWLGIQAHVQRRNIAATKLLLQTLGNREIMDRVKRGVRQPRKFAFPDLDEEKVLELTGKLSGGNINDYDMLLAKAALERFNRWDKRMGIRAKREMQSILGSAAAGALFASLLTFSGHYKIQDTIKLGAISGGALQIGLRGYDEGVFRARGFFPKYYVGSYLNAMTRFAYENPEAANRLFAKMPHLLNSSIAQRQAYLHTIEHALRERQLRKSQK